VLPNNVRLVALKKAQDGSGIVLRLAEVEGKAVAARIKLSSELAPPDAAVAAVDAMERPTDVAVGLDQGVLTVFMPAHGIVAVRVAA